MSSDAIFLLGRDGTLERVPYGTYVTEDDLQGLIADHPELLAGDQIVPDDPPRWLLVTREAGVPDAESASDRWSLDHLLLDHRAVPTFIEVKRSSDTRIRREVIGQMLEYAANATRYWPVDRIREMAAARYGSVEELDRRVRAMTVPEVIDESSVDVEAYWSRVEQNFRNGTLRLLFVADELPRELRRVIEFLNENMPRIEVLGVEIRQYAGSSLRALVPRVVGQTERARDAKPEQGRRKTSEAEFLDACPEWARPFFQEVLREAEANGLVVNWATKGFSIRGATPSGQRVSVLSGYPPGAFGDELPFLEVYMKYISDAQTAAGLRASLLALGAFREGGQYTVGLRLAPENLAQARAALPYLWDVYRRIQRPEAEATRAGSDAAPGAAAG